MRAEGEATAIQTVFDAIHRADPDPKLLAYQYLQALPQIAKQPVEQALDPARGAVQRGGPARAGVPRHRLPTG